MGPGRSILFLLALPFLTGAGFPEVIRVRVPAEKVATYFPSGTELRGMPLEEFEALVRAARSGFQRQHADAGPRLLRARHAVRWEEGRLSGRSELLIEAGGPGPSLLVLDPWTPALDAPATDPAVVLNRPDGKTALRVSATGTVTLSWELRARPESDGHVFTLGLPGLDAAALTLDLPAGWEPEGPSGIRQGPTPGSAPDRRSWRFDGPGGLISLLLRAPSGRGGPSPASTVWVGGPTRIDVDEVTARWRADWTVEPGPSAPRRVSLLLDPGLEVLEVGGPGVLGFQAEPSRQGTRLVVRLAQEVSGRTPLVLSAEARVPAEGPWTIPAARPLDATWTGGKTVVRLGPSRVLEDCRERAGRRVIPRPDDPGEISRGGPVLVFEAASPAAVAELTFRRPPAEVTAEVRGQLRVGGDAPHLDALLTWKVVRGRLLSYAADLSSGWTADRVQTADGKDSIPWQAEPQPGGGTRVQIRPPPTADAGGVLALTLSATAKMPPGATSLSLPRVRPVGVPVGDEIWIAREESDTTLRPLSAQGLAWIDPTTIPADAARSSAEAAGLPAHLGWRWITPEGRARVALDRVPIAPLGTIRQVATVDADRLTLRWLVAIEEADEPLRTVSLGITEPLPAPPEWRRLGEEDGPPLASRPLDAKARGAVGLPAGGSAWEIDLPGTPSGLVTLVGRLERPWGRRGSLPLLVLPARFRTRGSILVLVDRAARSVAQASRLHALDPFLTAQEMAAVFAPGRDEGPGPDRTGHRRAHAFSFRGRPGPLVLETETLIPAQDDGLIAEATLRTRAAPAGPARHRLTLRVVTTGARSLAIDLPRDAVLQRARGDGRPWSPTLLGSTHHFTLPGPAELHPSCTLVLDYTTPRGPSATGPALRPDWPRFSLPCLSLGWEVAVPEPWEVTAASPDLVVTDPAPSSSWLGRLLGSGAGPSASAAGVAMMRDLDARAAASGGGAATLGERLQRWDAGLWPVIVDRSALAAAGAGPETRETRRGTRLEREKGARAVLEPLGLTVVAVDGVLLVTSRAEAPDRPGAILGQAGGLEAWERALREAVAWGADASDRFQTVVRWRGEPTPEGPAGGPEADGTPLTGHSSIRRFEVSGVPAAGSELVLADTWTRALGGWGVALAILTLAGAVRNLPEGRVARGLIALLIVAPLVVAWAWADGPAQALGALAGGLAVAAFGLVQRLRARLRKRHSSRRMASSIRRRRTATGITPALALGASLTLLVARLAAVPAPADVPILALLPYDGMPDLADPAPSVLLLLKDHDRLRAWAQAGPSRPEVTIGATAASHHVGRGGDPDAVLVESRYVLWNAGEGASSWDVPVGEARDLVTTLDGREVPALIRPGGRSAIVPVAGAGRHRLVIRRSLPRQRTEAGETLLLPVNPVASARLTVGPAPEGQTIERPGASGSISPKAGGVEVALGPVDRLEVRWVPAARAGGPDRLGTVEGFLLWDAEPAGDRLRARWTFRNPGGTARVRLALEAGVVVRSASAARPGVLDADGLGSAERPEWVARFDPPLGDGEVLAVEFWRPAAAPGPEGTDRSSLQLPRVEPLGAERYAGVVGFRRPGDWSGRLGSIPGTEAISDEAFVRAWGTLPKEPLTLAGTSRFSGVPAIGVPTGPVPARPAIKPAVRLELVPGRVNVRVDAELVDRGGRSFEVIARIPDGLRLVRVDADGLTHWSRPAPDGLRLRFDGAEASPRRTIRLEGWLPVEADPMALGDARREVDVPWPRWPGAEEEPGILTVLGPPSAQVALKETTGVVKRGPAEVPAPARLAFLVERPDALGRLSWTAEPPRVDVSVRSQLRLDPGSARWTTQVDYQVSGGAIDAIRLKLPGPWATAARVEVAGAGHRLTSETVGEATVWTIRPDLPIWGPRRISLRSEQPWPGTAPLSFPDLIPLGRGTVDTYLAVVAASGRPLEIEGTSGIEPVEGGRYPPEDDAEPPGSSRRVYRVRQEGWSLRVRAAEAPAPVGSGTEEAQLLWADVVCVLAADGTAWGEACLEVKPGTGAFVAVVLPGGAAAVAAAVAGRPVRPLRGASGRWLVPVGDGAAGQVVLVWQTGRAAPTAAGGREVPLPGLVRERVPLLVTVLAPEAWRVESLPGPVQRVGASALEAERAAGHRRRIAAALDVIDRGSVAERQALIDAVLWFEVRARLAEREARRDRWTPSPTPPEALQSTLERLQETRRRLAEELRLAGFGALVPEVQATLGLPGTGPETGTAVPPEPSAPFRIRRLGRPHHFLGETGRQGHPPLIRWTTPAPPPGDG